MLVTIVNHHSFDKYVSNFLILIILINYRCLKHYLTPVYIENSNIMEMCGRICSILTLFIPVSNYNCEKLLNSLNLIYEEINCNLGK